MSLATCRALLRLEKAYRLLDRQDLSPEDRRRLWEEEVDRWLCNLSQQEILAIIHTLSAFRGLP